MKIGIVVHSDTGNTHAVARALQEKLSTTGHSVDLMQLEFVGASRPGAKDIQLETLPNIDHYDVVVLGAPVHAFSLSAVMKTYAQNLTSLQNRKVALIVTQHFPYAWMGGNRATRQLKAICQSKGASVIGSLVVNWSRSNREQQITTGVEKLITLF